LRVPVGLRAPAWQEEGVWTELLCWVPRARVTIEGQPVVPRFSVCVAATRPWLPRNREAWGLTRTFRKRLGQALAARLKAPCLVWVATGSWVQEVRSTSGLRRPLRPEVDRLSGERRFGRGGRKAVPWGASPEVTASGRQLAPGFK
jgi:hypothetical protein